MKESNLNNDQLTLEASWKTQLVSEFQKDYMQKLKEFLRSELAKGKVIYPSTQDYFHAFNSTPFSQVKVVIIGQDPYHGPNQAHGLSFSVKPGVRIPPSLQNINKELRDDLGIPAAEHGYLQAWAEQGVLLLNTVLTVEQVLPTSHQNKGWEQLTDRVIQVLNDKRENLVFVLWGTHAQLKGRRIDRQRHLVIESPHPSPLSAHRGFFGSRPFSKINQYLAEHQMSPINWQLPDHLDS
ncbi:MAG: uracil-DNA glycosylase [Proteobacteria bacterium]|nr:uracil-DNA glycosylase [Pseudomonadota bacterium]